MKAIALSTVVSTTLVGVLAASAGATTPAPVTFKDNETVAIEPFGPGFPGAGTSTGVSIASGAVADSFALTEQFMFGDGTIHLEQTLTNAKGTIAMSIDASVVGFTATTLTVQGHWAITSGIGGYASLHGYGTYASTVETTTHTITATLTGFGQYDAGR